MSKMVFNQPRLIYMFVVIAFGLFSWSTKAQTNEKGYLSNIYHYIENTEIYEINQQAGHTTNVPFSNLEEALKNNRWKSANVLSLNGTWKFQFVNTPEEVNPEFFKPGFNDKSWSNIQVPSNWEMQGFGDPLFRNVSQPFKANPPYVPREYNPTGSYRRDFILPKNWKGQNVILRMEKTASASFVWINGEEAGYNEGAQEPAEYDITKYLKTGKNTISVCVIKYSDGVYLEDQDYWRLAGIFDDIWLYAVPEVHVFDWYATTDLDDKYVDAQLNINLDVKNYSNKNKANYTIRTILYNNENKPVQTFISEKITIAANSVQNIKLSEKVEKPALWSAEFPNLYKLSFEIMNAEGKTEEITSGRIGFKETEIRHQVFYLNGVPIKLNGINSHMQHPDLGHQMNEETIRKDFAIFKQFNINCVRTSHYPPVQRYLELADEYGIYIADETGDESHATQYLSEDKAWTAMYKERAQKMVLRDRNHPCVLFWSAGNESGEGNNICEVISEGKKLDPTRYWMYGGNAFAQPCEEIIGPRYYTPFEMKTLVGRIPENIDPRPSFMDEYLSVAGNGGGGLDEYWDAIYSYPRLMGGAIWDFVSTGIREKVRLLNDESDNKVQANIMGRAKLVKGKKGLSIDLNGHDQWVEIYQDQSVEIKGNELSISLWAFPRKLNSSCGSFITKGNHQFGLQQRGTDSLEFYLTTETKNRILVKLPDNWENNWHHLAGIYDGKTMSVFIDGKLAGSNAAKGNIKNFPFPVNIGRNAEIHGQETSVYICDAIIDEVGIFDRTIAVDSLMNASQSLKKTASAWFGFDNETPGGEFFSYGIGARTYGSIWPDRRVQPEMWQIKKSAQPVSVKWSNIDKMEVEIWNRYHFTNLKSLKSKWILQEDGKTIQEGILEPDLAPLSKLNIKLPVTKPQLKPGAHYRLLLSFCSAKDEIWSKAGFEIAWDQLELPWFEPIQNQGIDTNLTALQMVDKNESLQVIGKDFSYAFDKKTGKLSSVQYLGKEIIKQGARLNLGRAPLANELDDWAAWGSGMMRNDDGYGNTIAGHWFKPGIYNLNYTLEKLSYSQKEQNITLKVNELVTFENEINSGFENEFIYTIKPSGEMTIQHSIIPNGTMPAWLPRIGVEWILDKSMENVNWYGRGPQENYPDRKTGYKVGVYSSTVNEMYEPYLIPQDYGLRSDNYWVKITDEQGIGLQFSGSELFNFNAYPYSTENLTKALYTYQLQKQDGITFNFDYKTTGVGCTARSVFNPYRTLPFTYTYTTFITPLKLNRK
ncbi:MAG: glycoside hydrolase family 2 TIM barrel-domain containing protein [Bacteroidales bacterium]